jgi:hypothetical protein
LAIALGICAILIQAMKIMTEIGYSVVAFYAADSGIETALYDLYQNPSSPSPSHSGYIEEAQEISYQTSAKCCQPGLGDCTLVECPLGDGYIDSNCDALNYCLKSRGSYQRVKRAIEINY